MYLTLSQLDGFIVTPWCLAPTFRPHKSIMSLNAEILCTVFWRLWLLNLTNAVYAVICNSVLVIKQTLLSQLIFSSSFCTHRNICTPKLSWRWFSEALEEGKEKGRGREQHNWRLIIPKLDMLLLCFFPFLLHFCLDGLQRSPVPCRSCCCVRAHA